MFEEENLHVNSKATFWQDYSVEMKKQTESLENSPIKP